MNAIARRRPGDMLSKTITVTTEPGLVNATANPRPAISGVSVPTVLPPSRQRRSKLFTGMFHLTTSRSETVQASS
jgi:hypothetical protein